MGRSSRTQHAPARRAGAAVRRIAHPVTEFLSTETAGAGVLLAAAVVALVWANSPFAESYTALWESHLTIGLAGFDLTQDLRHWVNDGLMAIFFFVVGLEIKREIVTGELRELKKAMLPLIAAGGGMVVPALIYIALNAGTEVERGWGIPMATDIAFAVGVLALLGPRIPAALKVFLLALAIVDDIGAILVIALFYSSGIEWSAIFVAVGLLIVIIVLGHMRLPGVPQIWLAVHLVLGVGVWLATLQSGVHATIAGVALGLAARGHPAGPGEESVSTAERLENLLHPWSSLLVLPIFALANAGISLAGFSSQALTSTVTVGIVLGLVVGKFAGVLSASWLGVKLRVASLPTGVGWTHVSIAGAVAGIGFTVSLFITILAFGDGPVASEAKVGVFTGSVLAALLGAALALRLPRAVAPTRDDL